VSVRIDDIAPEDVSRNWPVSLPSRVQRTERGTNNRSFIVDCDGSTYFLKHYDNQPDPARCLFEHRITAAIAAQDPPFAVPETILSRSGETHILLGDRNAALFTFIPGSAARYGDRDDAAGCGRALADLHAALAEVDLGPPDAGPRTFGDLATVHPLVPDPEGAIRDTINDEVLVKAATASMSSTQSRWQAVTSGWPLTWIHGDFYPTNVLQQSHRVTGIVDFEFAGAGYRAMDVAIGLYAFAIERADMELLADCFAGGYLSRMNLSPGEIEAVPTMILMREATSLTHWTGRYRQGLTNAAGIGERARQFIGLARFLDRNGADLVKRLHEIGSRPRQ